MSRATSPPGKREAGTTSRPGRAPRIEATPDARAGEPRPPSPTARRGADARVPHLFSCLRDSNVEPRTAALALTTAQGTFWECSDAGDALCPDDEDGRADDDDDDDDADALSVCPDELAEANFASLGAQRRAIARRATSRLAAGVALVVLSSAPMPDCLDVLADQFGVSNFAAGFVLVPLCTQLSELAAIATFAAKKTSRSLAYVFEQLLGAAALRNCLALFVLLAWLKARRKRWDYVASATVLLVVQLAVAALSSRDAPATLYHAALVLGLYPAAVAAVLALRSVDDDL